MPNPPMNARAMADKSASTDVRQRPPARSAGGRTRPSAAATNLQRQARTGGAGGGIAAVNQIGTPAPRLYHRQIVNL
jgi:hypothetical protein